MSVPAAASWPKSGQPRKNRSAPRNRKEKAKAACGQKELRQCLSWGQKKKRAARPATLQKHHVANIASSPGPVKGLLGPVAGLYLRVAAA